MRPSAARGSFAPGLAVFVLLLPAAIAAQTRPAEVPSRSPAGAHPPGGAPATPPPSAEQLAEWAEQLDADEFLKRDTAMLRLLEAGSAALPVVERRLHGGSVEATSRALYILRQLGLSADLDTQERAWTALDEAAQQVEAPALARRAAATLDQLRAERSVQALAELRALGAEFQEPEFNPILGFVEPIPALEIGEAFRGAAGDLRRLKWLADVPIIKLAGPNVTDEWLPHVAAMPDIRQVHLYQVKISDRGLDPLANCGKLEQVGVYYTPTGDRVLEPLAKAPALRFIKLYGTQVTAEVVAGFEQTKGAKVDHRRGAFLGVGASPAVDACVISRVHEESPAEKAKLAMNDVIVGFGGEKVTSFDSLTALISRRDAGEEVEIEVLRQTIDADGNSSLRTITTKAKLAPWQFELAVLNGPR